MTTQTPGKTAQAPEAEGSQHKAVYFQITDGAMSEMIGGLLPIIYVGVTYRIPMLAIQEAQRIFTETNDEEKAQAAIEEFDLTPEALNEKVKAAGYTVASDPIIERFDTVDAETGDILVLLRVPCLPF